MKKSPIFINPNKSYDCPKVYFHLDFEVLPLTSGPKLFARPANYSFGCIGKFGEDVCAATDAGLHKQYPESYDEISICADILIQLFSYHAGFFDDYSEPLFDVTLITTCEGLPAFLKSEVLADDADFSGFFTYKSLRSQIQQTNRFEVWAVTPAELEAYMDSKKLEAKYKFLSKR
jgi:hypothetical protein